MKRWLHENPWIWLVVFFVIMVLASLVTIGIAEFNRPEIVR